MHQKDAVVFLAQSEKIKKLKTIPFYFLICLVVVKGIRIKKKKHSKKTELHDSYILKKQH